MKIPKIKHILSILIIYLVYLTGGYFLLPLFDSTLAFSTYSALATLMTIIALGAYLISMAGLKKGEKEQGIYFLAGLGMKFLAYLFLLLGFWLSGKKLSLDFIIAFFVLYLVFTIFLISTFTKVLKIK